MTQLPIPHNVPMNDVEKRLWESADELRANSKLKSSEYSIPVLGLIFLRFADERFERAREEVEGFRGEVEGERPLSPSPSPQRGDFQG